MTCYHPLLRVEDRSKFVKAKDGHLYHPSIIMSPDKYELETYKGETKYRITQEIPCGKCIGCRLDYSREWANRAYLESTLYEQTFFVTLTYDDSTLCILDLIEDSEGITYTLEDNEEAWTGTLVPSDLQKFLKRLRKRLEKEKKIRISKGEAKESDDWKIRYIACGEYGGKTERPHYHLIIFNLKLPIEDLYEPRIINKEIYYRSKIIEESWGLGFCNVSEAKWNAMAYVSRYITKKINGQGSEEQYASTGKDTKEFMRVSRMPGIGEPYYRKNWKKIYENDYILVKNRNGVIEQRPPKYFDKILEKEHPEIWEKVKQARKTRQEMKLKLQNANTSLLRAEQLEVEERTKDEKTQMLIRRYEASQ